MSKEISPTRLFTEILENLNKESSVEGFVDELFFLHVPAKPIQNLSKAGKVSMGVYLNKHIINGNLIVNNISEIDKEIIDLHEYILKEIPNITVYDLKQKPKEVYLIVNDTIYVLQPHKPFEYTGSLRIESEALVEDYKEKYKYFINI